MATADSISVDRIVSAYIKVRDKKNEVTRELKEREAEYDQKLDTLKAALLEHCEEVGAETVRTKAGTFYRTVKKRFWTSDWEALNEFILEHEAVDLLEKRIHQGNMKSFLEENPDLLPPGLNADSEYTVNVRRAKQ